MNIPHRSETSVRARLTTDSISPPIRLWVALALGVLFTFGWVQPAAAAEFGTATDVYILPQGQVIADDLYVAAPEIVIDGTVEGDLLAAGGTIIINGAVNGSVMAAGAGIDINGVVQNSARVAGFSVNVNGTIRKDLVASGGGPFTGPFGGLVLPMRNQMLTPGIELTSGSSIGGDAVLTAAEARLGGVIGGDLMATVNQLALNGAVRGGAYVQSSTFTVADNARIAGTLTYVGEDPPALAEGTAGEVVIVPPATQTATAAPTRPNPILTFLGWLWRLVIQLIGLALIAWLVWTFFPNWLRRPAAALESRPVESALYGFVGVVVALPLAFALVLLGVLFWGWFPGGASFSAIAFGLLGVGWLLSPVFVGTWIGQRMLDLLNLEPDSPLRGELPMLLLGTLSVVLVASLIAVVPCVGPVAARLIYLLTFALALGGILQTRLRPAAPMNTQQPVPVE